MSVFPGDVVSTAEGVLHVWSVIMERSRVDVSFAVSGVDGDGVGHVGVPVTGDEVPLAVDVSESEALVWFDRERRLRRLGDAVFSPGDGVRALGRLMPGRVDLSLTDRNPANTVSKLLLDAKDALAEARDWVLKKRRECLDAFAERYADYQAESPDEPLDEVLGTVYAEMFSFGEGKPLCLPSPAEEYTIYGKTYEECAARLMEATFEMMFDISKSISYIEWVHGELNALYNELARELDPACWEVVEKLSI